MAFVSLTAFEDWEGHKDLSPLCFLWRYHEET